MSPYHISEDSDLVISRDFLGFGGEMAPNRAPSKKQTRKRLQALKDAAQEMIGRRLLPALHEAISQILGNEL
jgi:hypothetical protein